jgi:hypothetical protein
VALDEGGDVLADAFAAAAGAVGAADLAESNGIALKTLGEELLVDRRCLVVA